MLQSGRLVCSLSMLSLPQVFFLHVAMHDMPRSQPVGDTGAAGVQGPIHCQLPPRHFHMVTGQPARRHIFVWHAGSMPSMERYI